MDLRQMFSERSGRAVALGGVLAAIAALFFYFQSGGAHDPESSSYAFYTVDDGKTWFKDDASKLPPYVKDGKQAVRAYVYRAKDGTEFVNHLERFKSDVLKLLEDAKKAPPTQKGGNQSAIQGAYMSGREVKRPGAATWIGTGAFRDAAQITVVKCPNGSAEAEPIEP